MRIHLPRLCAVLVACLALSWLLSLQYFRGSVSERFTLSGTYSATLGEFIIWETGPDYLRYRSEDGKSMGSRDARLNMPFLFARDVRIWDGFPVRIGDREYTFEDTRLTRIVSMRPRMWNPDSGIALYMLLESEPEGSELEVPSDMFRFTGSGVEFIICADGSLDEKKSKAFSKAMKDADVHFPVVSAGQNATCLKPFDMGVLFADSDGRLFTLRMVRGLPECRDLGLAVSDRIRYIGVAEHEARDYYGFVVTENDVYLVSHADTLLRLPLESFNPSSDSVSVRLDAANLVLSRQTYPLTGASPLNLMAGTREGDIFRERTFYLPEAIQDKRQRVEDISSMLFPIALQQFEPTRGRPGLSLRPRASVARHLGFAACGAVVWLGLLFFIRGRRGRAGLADYCLTAVFGLPGLISVLFFGPVGTKRRQHS